jgi:hypothetical protein
MHVRFALTLAAALIVVTHPHGTAAAADCSKAAVRDAAAQAGVANPDFPDEVLGGVCGAFLGPGSEAMGVVLRAQQCAPNRIWTVLSFTDGAWRHVPGPWDRGPRIDGLRKVGDDIREEQPVFRAADNGCRPTGGSRARLWHWDGTRLKPGRFRRAQRPDPRPRAFKAFAGAVACAMRDDHHGHRVTCAAPRIGVRLDRVGGVERCHCARPHAERTLRAFHGVRTGQFSCYATAARLSCLAGNGRGFALTSGGRLRIITPPPVE